jgi:FkbM family methyltransferase
MAMVRTVARELRQGVLKAYAAMVLGVPVRRLRGLALRRTANTWVAFRRGTSDEEVLEHSFADDIFLPGVPEYQPRAGDTVLDVGAHLGDFALLVAGRIGHGKVWAVEPAGATFAVLETNVALNPDRSIEALRLALADRDGTCTLYHAPPGESWGDSTSHDYAGAREEVPCRRLDTFMAEHGIERVDFAKFNCEGGEFAILMAADAATLRRIRTMLVLYHCDFAEGASEAELIAHLEAAGFATAIRNRTAERGWIVARQSAA